MYDVSVSVTVSYLYTTARKVSALYLDTKSGEVCVSYLDTEKKYLCPRLHNLTILQFVMTANLARHNFHDFEGYVCSLCLPEQIRIVGKFRSSFGKRSLRRLVM